MVNDRMEKGSRVLGVGIIGCLHLPALRSLRSIRAVAIADGDPGRLRLVGDRFALERRYRGRMRRLSLCTLPGSGSSSNNRRTSHGTQWAEKSDRLRDVP